MIIGKYLIEESVYNILIKLRGDIKNGKLSRIDLKSDQIKVTCPVHKGGHELHPSCVIYGINTEKPNWYCFTCGKHGDFVSFVEECLETDYNGAKEWLLENFNSSYIIEGDEVSPIWNTTFSDSEQSVEYIDEEKFFRDLQSYHPYMSERGLTDETIKKFELKYDPLDQTIVFPIRDKNGGLISFTKRSVNSKKFHIAKSFKKENLYLLYNILQEQPESIGICEGQFSALMAYQYGLPSVALIGAGTTEAQMEVINSLPINHFVLLYDGDDAGRKGAAKFKKLVKKSAWVDDIILPEGKDPADLSKEEFWNYVNNNDKIQAELKNKKLFEKLKLLKGALNGN